MADLNILLSADLDVQKSIKDINASIARVQEKIVGIKLKIDPKALTDAGVILKGISETTGDTAKSIDGHMKKVTQSVSKLKETSTDAYKEAKKQIALINKEIGDASAKGYNIKTDKKGKPVSATIRYANLEMGKEFKKTFKWVEKEIDGEISRSFEEVGQEFVRNLSVAEKRINKIADAAKKAKEDLKMGKGSLGDLSQDQRDDLYYTYSNIEAKARAAAKKNVKETTIKKWEDDLYNADLSKNQSVQMQKDLSDAEKEADRLASRLKSVQKNAEDLKHNLDIGKIKIFDEDDSNKLKSEYQSILDIINQVQKEGRQLGDEEIDSLQERLRLQKQLTEQIKVQQAEQMRTTELGDEISRVNLTQTLKELRKDTDKDKYGEGGNALKDLVKKEMSKFTGVSADNIEVDLRSTRIDKSTGKEIDTLTAKVKTGKDTFAEYVVKLNEATGALTQYGEETRTTANRNLSMFKQLQTALTRIPIWMAGMTAFYQTLHFFTEGVAYVNEFNKALTQLSIVYGESQSRVERFTDTFREMGQEMGIATLELANGAVELARQGLSSAETLERMQTAAKYAKISNLDYTESIEILTATINSMGISGERASDVFSYMGDATATGRFVLPMLEIA